VNIDDRLRAASKALKDSSITQIDAASRLRELAGHTHPPMADAPTVAVVSDRASERSVRLKLPVPAPVTQLRLKPQRPAPAEPSLLPAAGPPTRLRRKPERVAIAVNLLLMLVIGVLVVFRERYVRAGGTTTATPPASTVIATKIKVQVPAACLQATEQADAAISYLVSNIRDERLTKAIQAYQASRQLCRRSASRWPALVSRQVLYGANAASRVRAATLGRLRGQPRDLAVGVLRRPSARRHNQ
jgi:hypothetical protein